MKTTTASYEQPEPLKKRIDAVPEEKIAAMLVKHDGLQYMAARALGMSTGWMSERIRDSPYLQSVIAEAREHRLDEAEKALSNLVRKEELGSVCFTLKTIGKSRGYVETTELAVSPETLKSHTLLMRQMADFQASRKIEHKSQITEENS